MKKIISGLFIVAAIIALLTVVNITVMRGHSLAVIIPFAVLAVVEIYLSLDIAWGD